MDKLIEKNSMQVDDVWHFFSLAFIALGFLFSGQSMYVRKNQHAHVKWNISQVFAFKTCKVCVCVSSCNSRLFVHTVCGDRRGICIPCVPPGLENK